jgi:hypothetical protein
MNKTLLTISAAVLTLIAGCGGGGGGGSTTPPPAGNGVLGPTSPGSGQITTGGGAGTDTTIGAGTTTSSGTTVTAAAASLVIPIEPSISKLYQQGQFFAKKDNTVGADTYGVTVDYTFAGNTTFEGSPTNTETIKRDVTKNNAAFSSTTQSDYFSTGPFTMLGRYLPNAAAARYFVAIPSSQVRLPATGSPGQSGDFYNANVYFNTDKTGFVGTSTQKWVITAETDTTARFCINTVITATSLNNQTSTSQECYIIAQDGTVKSNLFTVSPK